MAKSCEGIEGVYWKHTQERLQEQPNETAMEDSADTESAEAPPANRMAEQNGLPVLRRSTRSFKLPDRLNL